MIVDDETLVRVGIQSLTNWEEYGYRISGTYNNGEEALKAMEKMTPSVLLTDIKMPGMGGIELIEKVHTQFPQVNIVALSGFNDFEYVRKVMKFGVRDYVLKYEVNTQNLISILDSFKYSEDPIEESLSPIDKERSDAAKCFMKSESFTKSRFPMIWNRLEQMGEIFCWMVMKPHLPALSPDTSHKAFIFLLEDIMRRFDSIIYLNSDDGIYYAIVTNADNDINSPEKLAGWLIEEIKEKVNIDLAVGLSRLCSLEKTFPEAYRGARKMLDYIFYQDSGIFNAATIPLLKNFSEVEWIELSKGVKHLLETTNNENVSSWISKLDRHSRGKIDPVDVTRLCRFAAYQLVDMSLDMGLYNDDSSYVNSLRSKVEELIGCLSFDELVMNTEELFNLAFNEFHIKVSTDFVYKVKKDVELNYGNNITLTNVANKFNYNTSYLSKRFAEKMGVSFNKYVTITRIEKAKKLLTSGVSVKEVAEATGFNSQNYFVKVFKRVTGKTITEFRQSK